MSNQADDAKITQTILDLVTARGPTASICPSEVARTLHGPEEWRSQMTNIRRVAITLLQTGQIEILRKGKPVTANEVRGVIRLRATS
jgi:hypothetical protein